MNDTMHPHRIPRAGTVAGSFLVLPLLALLLPLCLTAACGGGSQAAGDASGQGVPEATPEPPAPPATTVRTASPTVEDVVDTAVLPAELLPRRRAVLAAEVPGTVEAIHFEAGNRVGSGALLVQVDTRAQQQAVAEAEALDRQARDQHQRAEALFEKRSITREQVVDATAARDVAAARLASARLGLDKSRIEAPWGGRIAERHVEVGDYVVPGQPVAELVDVDRLKVRAPAPGTDVPYLEVGTRVLIRVDALPDETFSGKVTRLATEVDRASRTLSVEAEIDNPGERLRPGMLARLEIPRQTLAGALTVPLGAVVDLGGTDVLYVVEGERARRREVSLGPVVGSRVVVEAGLGPEDRVIIEGAQQVADGQRVIEARAATESVAGAGGV